MPCRAEGTVAIMRLHPSLNARRGSSRSDVEVSPRLRRVIRWRIISNSPIKWAKRARGHTSASGGGGIHRKANDAQRSFLKEPDVMDRNEVGTLRRAEDW